LSPNEKSQVTKERLYSEEGKRGTASETITEVAAQLKSMEKQ
jgi:hypothetical protein